MQPQYPTPPVPDANAPRLVVSVHRKGPDPYPAQTICVNLVPDARTSKLWITPQAAHQLADDLRWATGFYPPARDAGETRADPLELARRRLAELRSAREGSVADVQDEPTPKPSAAKYIIPMRFDPKGEALSRREKLILMVLACYHDHPEFPFWPSLAELAAACMTPETECRAGVARLESAGLLESHSDGVVNSYRFPLMGRNS